MYFDISKAFDSVPHERLIRKLESFGIRGPLLELLQNYLSNRSYVVKVGKSFSSQKPIPSGVPQGSVGGPILFTAYLADIVKICETPGVIIKLFADDLKIYYMSKLHNNFSSPLQSFIDKFVKYCEINGLQIALKKCSVLYIGNNNPQSKYFINGIRINAIQNKQPVRDLGLHFRSDLKWDSHIEIIIKKARRTSYAILKSIKTCDSKLLIETYKTFVRPTLEFATNVYNPY